jgi:hypothetical protein
MGDCNMDHMPNVLRCGHVRRHMLLDLVENGENTRDGQNMTQEPGAQENCDTDIYNHFYALVTLQGANCSKSIEAMLDSGAQGCFMHPCFVKENKITTIVLMKPIGLGNINDSPNHSGSITHYVVLKVLVNGHLTQSLFHNANIGHKDAILGINLLQQHNPAVDWSTDSIFFHLCPSCLVQKPMLDKVEIPLEPPVSNPGTEPNLGASPPMFWISANHQTCSIWWNDKVLTSQTDEM